MSLQPTIRFKPGIFLRLGNIKDDPSGKRIKKALHRAIWEAFDSAIEDTIDLGKTIIPESKGRNYPPSYKSERMMKTWIAHMVMEQANVASGRNTLRNFYKVQQRWDASYTKYVDKMVGVNWTKDSSQFDFVNTLQKYMIEKLLSHLNINIGALPFASAIWSGV